MRSPCAHNRTVRGDLREYSRAWRASRSMIAYASIRRTRLAPTAQGPAREEQPWRRHMTTPKLDEVTGTWVVDAAHSLAEFRVKYMMIVNVKGRFDELEGIVDLKDPVEDSTIDVTLQDGQHLHQRRDARRPPPFARLLRRRDAPRDDVPRQRIERTSGHGRTGARRPDDPRRVPSGHPWTSSSTTGRPRTCGASSGCRSRDGTTINRSDWDLQWNKAIETGGVLVGDRIDIELEVSLVRE